MTAVSDPRMPFLAAALTPDEAGRRVSEACGDRLGGYRLVAIRVTRHKPGRRCLVEYDFEPSVGTGLVTVVGKCRAKGADERTYRLMRRLWEAGFGADAADGVSVPEPFGIAPALGMWFQAKVPGVASTGLLAREGGVELARRIAGAIHKLHQAGMPADRDHTPADELAVLDDRLAALGDERGDWAARLDRVRRACRAVAAGLPAIAAGVHRDFYPDQVLVDGSRLYLLDFDLYCRADPALDAGNFIAHLTEQAVRTRGRADALADRERAFEDRYVELTGERCRAAVRGYAVLTLARHIAISAARPDRRAFTGRLLTLCEERLDQFTSADRRREV